MPPLTLPQFGTPLTSLSMGLVSCSDPFFTWSVRQSDTVTIWRGSIAAAINSGCY
jgi:hypothetical protein